MERIKIEKCDDMFPGNDELVYTAGSQSNRELTCDKNTLNNINIKTEYIDNKTEDLDIKTEYSDKIEEPQFLTIYLNEDSRCLDALDTTLAGDNTPFESRENTINKIQPIEMCILRVPEQMRKDATALQNCEPQTNCSNANIKLTCLLMDEGETTKQTNSQEKFYKCDVCNKRFTQSSDLTAHRCIHVNKNNVWKLKCHVCYKILGSSYALSRHLRNHLEDKPYKCDVCKKGFSESYALTRHKFTHTGEKPYKCVFCNKGFTDSSNFSAHTRIHTGEKPYKCDVCNKGFTTSTSLTSHKRIHTGEKPYECDICYKKFTQSHHMMAHRQIHTGERTSNFKCDVCNKGFRKSSILVRHKLIHTREKAYRRKSYTKS